MGTKWNKERQSTVHAYGWRNLASGACCTEKNGGILLMMRISGVEVYASVADLPASTSCSALAHCSRDEVSRDRSPVKWYRSAAKKIK